MQKQKLKMDRKENTEEREDRIKRLISFVEKRSKELEIEEDKFRQQALGPHYPDIQG